VKELKEDWQVRIIQLFAVAGISLAHYLYLFHEGVLFVSCDGTIWDCGKVSGPDAQFASVGPIPVAAIGMAGYIGIFLVTALKDWDWLRVSYLPEILVALNGLAFLFTLVLTLLEAFVIHAFCLYCVISAIFITIMFGLSISYLRDVNAAAE
jgi:uncharacterized membrane protein